jgi:hypothetical protein
VLSLPLIGKCLGAQVGTKTCGPSYPKVQLFAAIVRFGRQAAQL